MLKKEPIRIVFHTTDDDLRDISEQIQFVEPKIQSEDNMTTKDILGFYDYCLIRIVI